MKNDETFVKKNQYQIKILILDYFLTKKYQNKNIHKWYQNKLKIKKDFYILDVGCGTGAQSKYFSKNLGINGRLYSF